MVKTKSDIRKEILSIRKALDEKEVNELSSDIQKKLINLNEYNAASNVLIYSDYKNEVKTSNIIEHALTHNKNIYMPLVEGEIMNFYRINHLSELTSGYMGIKEPTADINSIYKENLNSIIIMPLSVYDVQGNRIGYGGGYYDKYLMNHKTLLKIGLAYSFQEYNSVPFEKTDIKLDYIINEKEVIKIKNDKF